MSCILPTLDVIAKLLQGSDEENLRTTQIKGRIKNYLTTHMKDERTLKFYQKASFLDPRFKNLFSCVEEDIIQEARGRCTYTFM